MIDYLSYPKASIVRVTHPKQQVVGHKYNNVSFGIPQTLVRQYWRKGDNGTADWYLPPDDPKWDQALPYVEAIKLYAEPQHTVPSFELARRMKEDQRRVAVEKYWAAVRALPGGMDPLWKYSSDKDDPEWVNRDDKYMLGDHNIGGWTKTWYPRMVLRMRYGTTSLAEYAERNGVRYPEAL